VQLGEHSSIGYMASPSCVAFYRYFGAWESGRGAEKKPSERA
jgi:hypothetical protein